MYIAHVLMAIFWDNLGRLVPEYQIILDLLLQQEVWEMVAVAVRILWCA